MAEWLLFIDEVITIAVVLNSALLVEACDVVDYSDMSSPWSLQVTMRAYLLSTELI